MRSLMLERYFFSMRLCTFLFSGSCGGDPGGLSSEERARERANKVIIREDHGKLWQKFVSTNLHIFGRTSVQLSKVLSKIATVTYQLCLGCSPR